MVIFSLHDDNVVSKLFSLSLFFQCYCTVTLAPKGQEWKNWEGEKLPMKDDD
jgi:hypothetical protein